MTNYDVDISTVVILCFNFKIGKQWLRFVIGKSVIANFINLFSNRFILRWFIFIVSEVNHHSCLKIVEVPRNVSCSNKCLTKLKLINYWDWGLILIPKVCYNLKSKNSVTLICNILNVEKRDYSNFFLKF